ncbi:Rv1733c family protein [Streptomyces sp. UG1]|uniref:Rv1733c family protein n=1 Tax=Streptomyces sp. UG1 TaxID=3417652 RepID=UPI003CEE4507
MSDGTCAKKRLWRWHSNPLRRRDDVIEAWIVLAVWAVILVGGTVVGLMTAQAADETFTRQRAERHSARAVLLADVPASAGAAGATRALAKIGWTDPDGTAHTDRTLVDTGQKAGAEVAVWLDGRGALVSEPPSPTEAAIEAGVLGTAATAGLAGAVIGAGALARWRLDRRRIDQWGREWDLVGPQWGHKTG